MIRYLILEDGTVFKGLGFGYLGETYGELVFTTSMTGYLESMSDPSYRNQILTFASPTIGNYPISKGKFESRSLQVSGIVTRDAHAHLKIGNEWSEFDRLLQEHKVPGLDMVDTRQLVRKIRQKGVMRAYISSSQDIPESFPDPMAEDVVSKVTCGAPYDVNGKGTKEFLFIDVGTKYSLLHEMSKIGRLHVVPYNTDFAKIDYSYDAVFIANGPGDPAHESLNEVVRFIRNKSEEVPIYGVCLGHQLISLALGASTIKMKFGHRGSNHAVTDGNRIYITSHNHGYAVDSQSLESSPLKLAQWDVNDQSVEMVRHESNHIFSVQYHPEASPGPHDSKWFFEAIRKDLEVR